MLTDVKSAYLAASGQFVNENAVQIQRTRVRGMFVNGTGTVSLIDGGAGGTTHITVAVTGSASIIIPGDGVLFNTNVYLSIGAATGVTIFYG